MSNIHIVIDSTCNVPAEMLAAYPNLHVVNLKIMLGSDEWNESEISCDELFTLVKEKGIFPRTSQPPLGEFSQAFAQAGENTPIIVITVSGGLSGTVNGARTVAKDCKEREIYVIDSSTASIGVIKMAEKALQLATDGKPAASIAQYLERMAEATRTLLIPDTLEYLHKGGRIGGAAALFGSILQIKPLLNLQDGKVQVLDKVRTRSRAINRMIDELNNYKDIEYIGIGHGAAPAVAEEIYNTLNKRYPNVPVSISVIGSALGAHLGPGIVGMIFQTKIADC